MIHKRNRFPSEFLFQVSNYLSLQDCYNCLYVCWSWYHAFHRVVYRSVTIKSESQLQRFITSLQLSKDFYNNRQYHHGLLIKELYLDSRSLVTSFRKESTIDQQVHISQNNLQLLSTLCPQLEVLSFDVNQWEHLTIDPAVIKWKQLQRCAPIYFCNLNTQFLTAFNGAKLVELTVVYRWEDLNSLVAKLSSLPALTKVALEVINDSAEIPICISRNLQLLHTSLPQLNHLSLVCNHPTHPEASSVTTRDPECLSSFGVPSKLKSLSLHGHVDSVKWFDFISVNYPNLESLSLTHLSTSRFGTKWMWQSGLVRMIQKLQLLRSLTLGGENVPQLFEDSFALELKKPTCSIQDVSIDFQTYQAIESCQFLLTVVAHGIHQLKHLKLRVWEQLPGWSGVTSNLFKCQQLVSLELSLSKGHIAQLPYTSFLIDGFLSHMPCLQDLVVVGADVQVTYNHFEDLDKDNRNFALRRIKLCQSRIENHETTLKYISYCCPKLEDVLLEGCEIDRKGRYGKESSPNICRLPFMYNTLGKVTLSSLLLYLDSVRINDFIRVELITLNSHKSIWCSIDKSAESSGYPTYELCNNQEECYELANMYKTYDSLQTCTEVMPCNYPPTIGTIILHTKSIPNELYLDNLRIPPKRLSNILLDE